MFEYLVYDDADPYEIAIVIFANCKESAQDQYIEQCELAGLVHGNLRIVKAK